MVFGTSMRGWSEAEVQLASDAAGVASTASSAGGTTPQFAADHKTLLDAAKQNHLGKAAPQLHPLADLLEQLNNGATQTTGDIALQHEYSVVGATLMDKRGKPTSAADKVSLTRSTVHLRDSLRSAEPREGGEADDGALDGAFSQTLQRFLGSFGQLDGKVL